MNGNNDNTFSTLSDEETGSVITPVGGNKLGLRSKVVDMIGTENQKRGGLKAQGLLPEQQIEAPREKTLEWQRYTKQVAPSQSQLDRAKSLIATNEQFQLLGSMGASIQSRLMGKIDQLWSSQQPSFQSQLGIPLSEEERTFSDILQADTQQDAEKEVADINNTLGLTGEDAVSVESIKNMTSLDKKKLANQIKQKKVYGYLDNIANPETAPKVKDPVTGEMRTPTTAEMLADFNTYMGRDPGTPIALDDIQSWFPTKDAAVAEILATGLADNIQMDTNMLTELGYSTGETEDGISITTVLNTLGLTPANLGDLTVQQFQDRVNDYISKQEVETVNVDALMARLESPYTSESQKEVIREQLAQAGASGALAASAEAKSLMDRIETSEEQLTFGDKIGTLEDLLNDEDVTRQVVDYLQGDVNKREESKLPDAIKNLIEENEDLFNSLTKDLDDDLKSFAELQEVPEEFSGINNELFKQMFPKLGEEFATGELDTSNFGGLSILKDEKEPANVKENLTATINEIGDKFGAEKAGMFLQIKDQKVLKDIATNELSRQNYTDNLNTIKTIEEIDIAEENAVEQMFDQVSGLDSEVDLEDILTNLDMLAGLGVEQATKDKAELEKIFKAGSPEEIKARLLEYANNYATTGDGNIFTNLKNYTNIEDLETVFFESDLGEKFIEKAQRPETTGEAYDLIYNTGIFKGKSYEQQVAIADQLSKSLPKLSSQFKAVGEFAKDTGSTLASVDKFSKVFDYALSEDVGGMETSIAQAKAEISDLENLKKTAKRPELLDSYIQSRKNAVQSLNTKIEETKRIEEERKRKEEETKKANATNEVEKLKSEISYNFTDPKKIANYDVKNLESTLAFLGSDIKRVQDKINETKDPYKMYDGILTDLKAREEYAKGMLEMRKAKVAPKITDKESSRKITTKEEYDFNNKVLGGVANLDSWFRLMGTNIPGMNKSAAIQDTLYRLRNEAYKNPKFLDTAIEIRKKILERYGNDPNIKLKDYAKIEKNKEGMDALFGRTE